MDPHIFERYSNIAYKKAGIRLREGKESLVAARVAKRLRVLGLAGPAEYLEYLENDKTGDELIQFLDVISTNFTSFFREPVHFAILSDLVRDLVRAGRQRLRFWSAASSSGEEPYSMAISIAEAVGDAAVDWRILATDISTRVLERAKEGVYTAAVLRPVAGSLRARYFEPTRGSRGGEPQFAISRELRQHMVFKRLNLAEAVFPMRGPLDCVFCRNVMIYFDEQTRQALISRVESLLAESGLFLIGHSESLTGLRTQFRARQPSVYALGGGASRRPCHRAERANEVGT